MNDLLIFVALQDEFPAALAAPHRVVYTGVGKVNAALAAAEALTSSKPALAINYGSAGAVRPALSSVIVTSAILRSGREAEPEKITSSISPPRMRLAEVSPMTQRKASTRLDLPQPFGPTIPVIPLLSFKSVVSTKDLKPLSLSPLK